MFTRSLTTRALLEPFDEGFNWLTNQFLRHPSQHTIEFIILKAYFQISTCFAFLICLIKLLSKRFRCLKNLVGSNEYLYTQLNPLGGSSHYPGGETFVDVYLHQNQSKVPVDQLLQFLKYLVDDHRTALGLWDRNPILEYHFYYDDEGSEKHFIKNSIEHHSKLPLGPFDSSSEKLSSRDRFIAVKPLLNDLLEAATQTTTHRIMLLSTEDRDIVQYGIRLLQLLPNPPLICYVKPIGSNLSLELAIAADVVFEWGEGHFELVTRDRGSIDEVREDDRFWDNGTSTKDLKIFRPLVLLFKAHGPIELTQLTMSDLKALLDKQEYGSEFLSGLDFRQYLRLACSKGVIGIQKSDSRCDLVSPLDDDDLFDDGSALINLLPPMEKLFYKDYLSDPFLTQPHDPIFSPISNKNLEKEVVQDTRFESPQKDTSTGDESMITMSSDSELVTTSHRSSYTNLEIPEPIPEPSSSLAPRPQLKHAPSDLESMLETSVRPVKKKKQEPTQNEADNHTLQSTLKTSNPQRGSPKPRKARAKSNATQPTAQPISPMPIQKRNSSIEPVQSFISKRSQKRGSTTTERLPSFDLEKGHIISIEPYQSLSSSPGLWIKTCSQASGLIQKEINGFKSIHEMIIGKRRLNNIQMIEKKKKDAFHAFEGLFNSKSNTGLGISQFPLIKMRTEQEELLLEID